MDQRKQRQSKFQPKPPRKKRPTAARPPEVEEEDGNAAEAELLLRRFNENTARRGTRSEKKSLAQVVFDQGAASSIPIRTFGTPKDVRSGASSGTRLSSDSKSEQLEFIEQDAIAYNIDGLVPLKMEKQYREPWDYHRSYYPTTLPLRMPYAGNPEILDEAEFGEAARNLEYEESTINAASELGLLDEDEKGRILLFQLPPNLPLVRRSATAKGKEKIESLGSSKAGNLQRGCKLEELTEGFMGKLVIHKSGAVKLKLGETLYDVSPGSDCIFSQNIAAINTNDKHCCVLGDVRKRAIVTPDIDSLLNTVIDLG